MFVCTANICRSPMAERLTRARLVGTGITVASAGVAAEDGRPMSPDVKGALTDAGLDTAAFASRRLDADQVERASVVLVAERAHRPAVVAQVPSAVGRTFTIREFGRCIEASDTSAISGTPADRLAALVGVAAALRGALPPPSPRDDDIADPYLRGAAAAQACLEQLTSYLDGWTALVAGQSQ